MAAGVRKLKRVKGRNAVARAAHLRGGAGPMGGSRTAQHRRKRRADRREEQQAALDAGREAAATAASQGGR